MDRYCFFTKVTLFVSTLFTRIQIYLSDGSFMIAIYCSRSLTLSYLISDGSSHVSCSGKKEMCGLMALRICRLVSDALSSFPFFSWFFIYVPATISNASNLSLPFALVCTFYNHTPVSDLHRTLNKLMGNLSWRCRVCLRHTWKN